MGDTLTIKSDKELTITDEVTGLKKLGNGKGITFWRPKCVEVKVEIPSYILDKMDSNCEG